MTAKHFSDSLISERYASALYDLSLEKKCIDAVLSDLLTIQEYIKQNKDFKLLINSPLISSIEKLNIIQKILIDHSVNALTIKFIKLIANNKRLNNLASIIARYVTINAEKRGDVIVDITSADTLTNNQKVEVKNKLSAILGEKLSLNYNIDKKIMGGLIIKVGSKMIDSSLASQINKLKLVMKGAQ